MLVVGRWPLVAISGSIVAVLFAIALLAPVLAPYHYAEQHLELAKQPPGPRFWLGTDEFGRDILSRLLYGARISLMVALVVVTIEIVFGATLGLLAGYFGGRLDSVIMRVTDMMFAFPDILLAILITSILGPSIVNVFIALGLVGWPGMVRLVRSQVLSLRTREFVEAARAMGASHAQILRRHILPHLTGIVVVAATIGIGGVILAEATLSFLGIGVQPPYPSWGSMIHDAWAFRRAHPIMTVWPAATLALAVTAFNFLGDGLRDRMDPRSARAGLGFGARLAGIGRTRRGTDPSPQPPPRSGEGESTGAEFGSPLSASGRGVRGEGSTRESPLLTVRNLTVEFPLPGGGAARAVNGVSLEVAAGEVLGIVGESGSGKSMTALAVMRLVPAPGRIASGTIRFEGRDLHTLPERELQQVRGGRIGMVFQDPLSSLNPVLTVGFQVAEAIETHLGVDRREAWKRAVAMLERVKLPDPEIRARQFPHQLSGGQRQRVGIAIAFSCNPPLVIADEPTTALDVTVQQEILALMTTMARDSGTAIMLITHDLGVVASTCDRVAVMYAGQIVELGSLNQVFEAPRHPYTRALLASATRLDDPPGEPLPSIAGQPPDLRAIPTGCPFHPRCPEALDRCSREMPGVTRFADGSFARCWLLGEGSEGEGTARIGGDERQGGNVTTPGQP
jgi:peptide/nickel transport system permease protein